MLEKTFCFLIGSGLFAYFFFSLVKTSFAVTITITDFPSLISIDSFSVTASISGAATGTNYLRVDLYKDGTTNYFGETYNGSDWYNGSDGLQYLSIPVLKGSTASATVQGRVGNPNSTDFTENGLYKLKLRRYTNSGSYASTDMVSPVDVQIVIPTPTSTLIPTLAPTLSPTASPTRLPTLIPTKILFATITPTITNENSEISSASPEILGESSLSADLSPTLIPSKTVKTLSNSQDNLPKILIGLGMIFLISCGILIFRKHSLLEDIKRRLE